MIRREELEHLVTSGKETAAGDFSPRKDGVWTNKMVTRDTGGRKVREQRKWLIDSATHFKQLMSRLEKMVCGPTKW